MLVMCHLLLFLVVKQSMGISIPCFTVDFNPNNRQNYILIEEIIYLHEILVIDIPLRRSSWVVWI